MGVLFRPWRHYAVFHGRSRRTELLVFFLSYYGMLALLVVLGMIFSGGEANFGSMLIAIIWVFAGVIPSWAVTVRRLHDQDKSGWFILLSFIPYIGFLFLFAIAVWPGTKGGNSFGSDPRENASTEEHLQQIFS